MKFLRKTSFVCYALDNSATYPASIWDGDSGNRDSDDGVQAAPDHRDWGRMIGEMQAVQRSNQGIDPDNALNSVGAVTSKTGLSVVERGNAGIHKTILTLDSMSMISTDATTNGAHTSQSLYTFPEGHIVILGAHQVYPLGSIIAPNAGGDGYADDADLGIGVGSAAVVAAVGLTTTEENICAEADVDLTTLTSDAIESSVNSALVPLDGSASAIVAYLNSSTLDDADHGTIADALVVSGTITILWTCIGND
ncbi:hypothetical protein LCGC14_1023850 [marine sediment metagenome]|uniref:Uncharacterized protein n=1 Tax=marine sediment metagenome TaxID=412755 RepID=A0A0F9R2G9_9ZZZZ